MSVLFQFEKTIENAIVDFLVANEINAHPGRNIETISRNSVEAIFEYGGAMEEPRQTLGGKIEYNAHEGTISLLISTTREEGNDHNETLGKVRELFLNSRNGLSASGYNFLDLLPLGSVTTEQEEGNQDATVLQYTLKYLIDLNIPTAPPVKPSNIVSGIYPAAPANVASAAYPTAPSSIQLATEPPPPANIDLAKLPNKPSNVLIEDPFQNRWGGSFNGTSDYLQTSYAYDGTKTQFTYSMWIKTTDGTSSHILGNSLAGSYDTRMHIGFHNNSYYFILGSSSGQYQIVGSSASAVLDGQWHNLVFQWNGTVTDGVKLYVDGNTTPVYTYTSNRAANASAANLMIGGGWNAWKFGGVLDEVAIFESILTTADIEDIWNNGKPADLGPAGLNLSPAGWWRMGDDSNDYATSSGPIAQITDSSGNGNHATQATAANQPTFADLTGESIYV